MSTIDHDARRGSRVARRSWAASGRWELTPFRITLVYIALGFVALFVSDVLFALFLTDPQLAQVQAFKGGVEVLLTGGLVFVLARVSRAQLAATNTALERRREELQVLHRVLRHNLRNDLNVIEGYTERIEPRIDSDDGREMCDRIFRECDELVRYTEQAARIRRISARDPSTIAVDAVDVVSRLVEDHELLADRATVRTDLPGSAPVAVNHMFERALGELVTNAVVHASGDPTVSIAVVPDASPEGLTLIEVSDDGPGTPEYVQRVFSGPVDDQLLHLDGLGLWFVYLTVVASDGEFEIDSEPGAGTTVRLWVPTPSRSRNGIRERLVRTGVSMTRPLSRGRSSLATIAGRWRPSPVAVDPRRS